MCLQRHVIWDGDCDFWNADPLVSDLKELRFMAGVFRDTGGRIVQPEGLEPDCELSMTQRSFSE